MSQFKVGDRVRIKKLVSIDRDDTDLRICDTGKILKKKDDTSDTWGVRFDREIKHQDYNFDAFLGTYDMYGYQLEKIEEEKDMRLSDLRTGMVVETKCGNRYLVLQVEEGIVFMGAEGFNYMKSWLEPKHEEDMTCEDDDTTIMKVFKPVSAFQQLKETRNLLWERPQEQELTVREISERLGYPVKVVADHD